MDLLELEEEVVHMKQAMLGITDAIRMMLAKIVDLHDHTQEHHDLINGLGRTVTLLEEMMIGGPDETLAP